MDPNIAADNTPGNAEKTARIKLISGKEIGLQDSIAYASLAGPDKLLATQVIAGLLLSFDKTSTTWKPVDGFRRNDWSLNFIYFKDELNGFITGDRGTLLKTSDGGQSWTQLPSFSNYDLEKLTFIDEMHGYVVAERQTVTENGLDYSLKIFRTANGGKNWDEVYSKSGEVGGVFDIAAYSPETCLVAVGNKLLLRTDDGGKMWKSIEPAQGVTGIAFSTKGIGWLVTKNGEFLRSDDGGKQWRQPQNLSESFAGCEWNAIDMDRDGNGGAVSENGCVAFTKDGENWTKIDGPKNEHLRYVDINGPRGLIVSEQRVYRLEF